MYNCFRYSSDQQATHTVDLLVDLSKPVEDTLHIWLKHNAAGDTPAPDAMLEEYNIYRFYSSFPVGSFFPEGKKEAVIEINWTWETGAKKTSKKVKL